MPLVNATKLLIVAVLILALSSTCIVRGSGSSTISQSYEHTVYMPTSQGTLSLFTYRVGISIQTEPDGSWKENSHYEGIFSVQLEWYEGKLFPYGISILFPNNSLSLPGGYSYGSDVLNETILLRGFANSGNLTVSSAYNYDYYMIRFDVGKAQVFQGFTLQGAVELHPAAGFYVYNSTFGEGQLGYQQWFNAQNDIYITIRPEETTPLSGTQFQDFNDTMQTTLNGLKSQVMVLEIGVFILVILLPVSAFFLRRKRQIGP